jgi:hypothetical protein
MKPIYLLFLLFACANVAKDQISFYFENKGMTCHAFQNRTGQTIICGESTSFTSKGKSQQQDKDALFLISSNNGQNNQAYSYGVPDLSERFERILSHEGNYIITGYQGDAKHKFLLKVNANAEPLWGIESTRFRTLDAGHMDIDPNGNTLLMTKDSAAEAFYCTVHLIDHEGNCKWSKKISAIESMQDILCTRDQNFLISFKQKGAFIDGETRKKYYMNTFYKVNAAGQILWSRKFHFETLVAEDCIFSQILEDASGNLYFMGKSNLLVPKKQQLFLTKTNPDGVIQWSHVYASEQELQFKNACFDKSGNIVLLADGYAKNGGIAYMSITSAGEVVWAKIIPSAAYEQAVSIFPTKNSFQVVWDKLLNFAVFSFDADGKTCSDNVQELKLVKRKFPLLLDQFNGRWEDVVPDWKPLTFTLTSHPNISSVSTCQK